MKTPSVQQHPVKSRHKTNAHDYVTRAPSKGTGSQSRKGERAHARMYLLLEWCTVCTNPLTHLRVQQNTSTTAHSMATDSCVSHTHTHIHTYMHALTHTVQEDRCQSPASAQKTYVRTHICKLFYPKGLRIKTIPLCSLYSLKLQYLYCLVTRYFFLECEYNYIKKCRDNGIHWL